MVDKVQVALVGSGTVANMAHLPAWKRIREVDVVALCDTNPVSLRATAKRWSIPRVYSSFDELKAKEQDAVFDICTPPSSHADLAVGAMRGGHDVVLEKPMALNLQEARRIYDEYQGRRNEGVNLCIAHTFLFEPQILALRSHLRRAADDILAVNVEMLHEPDDVMIANSHHWVHSQGGRLAESAVHPIYLLRNLMGGLELREVYCAKKGSYEWVQQDELHATFDSRGRFGSIYISYNSPRWTHAASIRILGKRSILSLDGTNLTLVQQGPMRGYFPKEKPSKVAAARDSLDMAYQVMRSTAQNTFRVFRTWHSGHEFLFRSYVTGLQRNSGLPYDVAEAYESTTTYLDLLHAIETNLQPVQQTREDLSS
jgi:predicted dehydrogenase